MYIRAMLSSTRKDVQYLFWKYNVLLGHPFGAVKCLIASLLHLC